MFRFSQFAAPVIAGAMFIAGGCAADRPEEIPPTASTIVEGSKTVTAVAPHDGTVYIWDRNSDDIIYTGQVHRGDTVTVDAKENRVMYNNQVASERDLVDGHNYKVFFERSKQEDVADLAKYKESNTTTIRRDSSSGTTVVQPGSGGATIVTPPPAQPAPPPPSNTTIIQPAPQQPQSNTTIIQPAPKQPESNTTIIQPAPQEQPDSNTTIIRPAPSDGSTTIVQPSR